MHHVYEVEVIKQRKRVVMIHVYKNHDLALDFAIKRNVHLMKVAKPESYSFMEMDRE